MGLARRATVIGVIACGAVLALARCSPFGSDDPVTTGDAMPDDAAGPVTLIEASRVDVPRIDPDAGSTSPCGDAGAMHAFCADFNAVAEPKVGWTRLEVTTPAATATLEASPSTAGMAFLSRLVRAEDSVRKAYLVLESSMLTPLRLETDIFVRRPPADPVAGNGTFAIAAIEANEGGGPGQHVATVYVTRQGNFQIALQTALGPYMQIDTVIPVPLSTWFHLRFFVQFSGQTSQLRLGIASLGGTPIDFVTSDFVAVQLKSPTSAVFVGIAQYGATQDGSKLPAPLDVLYDNVTIDPTAN